MRREDLAHAGNDVVLGHLVRRLHPNEFRAQALRFQEHPLELEFGFGGAEYEDRPGPSHSAKHASVVCGEMMTSPILPAPLTGDVLGTIRGGRTGAP